MPHERRHRCYEYDARMAMPPRMPTVGATEGERGHSDASLAERAPCGALSCGSSTLASVVLLGDRFAGRPAGLATGHR